MQLSLSNQITTTLQDLTVQLDSVKEDTAWVVSNAMNKEDRAAVDARFNSLDSNLDKILQFCGESVTNSSALCKEVDNLQASINLLDAEQQEYFNTLNETTYNTWQLLSGDVNTKIDTILIDLNIIQDQNREINDTTHQILDEIQGEVQASIIS
jgi:septation ring formation regulator EzrA